MTKKILYGVKAILIVAVMFGLLGCDDREVIKVEEQTVHFEDQSISLWEGEELQLHSNITPEFIKINKLTWESENPAIASVDSNGKVYAIKEGVTIVTIKAEGNKIALCKVFVNPINYYSIDGGERKKIAMGFVAYDPLQKHNYDLALLPEKPVKGGLYEQSEYLWFQLDGAISDGKVVDLSNFSTVDKWYWVAKYQDKKSGIDWYGDGLDDKESESPLLLEKGSKLYIKHLNAKGTEFEVKFNLIYKVQEKIHVVNGHYKGACKTNKDSKESLVDSDFLLFK